MNKDLETLINETIEKTFAAATEKLIERGIREIQYDICPHCKTEIYEKHEYTEDGGTTWRHSDCKGLIARPETPLEQINRGLQPYVAEARQQRQAARRALGMESVIQGACPEDATEPTSLPIGGHEKYDKQQPEGPMSAVNTSGLEEASHNVEQEETKTVASRDYRKFNQMPINIVNTSKIPLRVSITEITSTVDKAVGKSAYIIRIDDVLYPQK
jgi:hypothetical protein